MANDQRPTTTDRQAADDNVLTAQYMFAQALILFRDKGSTLTEQDAHTISGMIDAARCHFEVAVAQVRGE